MLEKTGQAVSTKLRGNLEDLRGPRISFHKAIDQLDHSIVFLAGGYRSSILNDCSHLGGAKFVNSHIHMIFLIPHQWTFQALKLELPTIIYI